MLHQLVFRYVAEVLRTLSLQSHAAPSTLLPRLQPHTFFTNYFTLTLFMSNRLLCSSNLSLLSRYNHVPLLLFVALMYFFVSVKFQRPEACQGVLFILHLNCLLFGLRGLTQDLS